MAYNPENKKNTGYTLKLMSEKPTLKQPEFTSTGIVFIYKKGEKWVVYSFINKKEEEITLEVAVNALNKAIDNKIAENGQYTLTEKESSELKEILSNDTSYQKHTPNILVLPPETLTEICSYLEEEKKVNLVNRSFYYFINNLTIDEKFKKFNGNPEATRLTPKTIKACMEKYENLINKCTLLTTNPQSQINEEKNTLFLYQKGKDWFYKAYIHNLGRTKRIQITDHSILDIIGEIQEKGASYPTEEQKRKLLEKIKQSEIEKNYREYCYLVHLLKQIKKRNRLSNRKIQLQQRALLNKLGSEKLNSIITDDTQIDKIYNLLTFDNYYSSITFSNHYLFIELLSCNKADPTLFISNEVTYLKTKIENSNAFISFLGGVPKNTRFNFITSQDKNNCFNTGSSINNLLNILPIENYYALFNLFNIPIKNWPIYVGKDNINNFIVTAVTKNQVNIQELIIPLLDSQRIQYINLDNLLSYIKKYIKEIKLIDKTFLNITINILKNIKAPMEQLIEKIKIEASNEKKKIFSKQECGITYCIACVLITLAPIIAIFFTTKNQDSENHQGDMLSYLTIIAMMSSVFSIASPAIYFGSKLCYFSCSRYHNKKKISDLKKTLREHLKTEESGNNVIIEIGMHDSSTNAINEKTSLIINRDRI